jgi:hypothetical protein
VDGQDASPPVILIEGAALQLAALLKPHGLTVTAQRDGTIVVRNPAGVATDPRGMALYPGLSQRVTLREDEGGLWWCWLWPRPTRDAPLDVEPMVPIEDTAEAVRRIAAVLRVEEPNGAQR